jgi:hypothetical protein
MAYLIAYTQLKGGRPTNKDDAGQEFVPAAV